MVESEPGPMGIEAGDHGKYYDWDAAAWKIDEAENVDEAKGILKLKKKGIWIRIREFMEVKKHET